MSRGRFIRRAGLTAALTLLGALSSLSPAAAQTITELPRHIAGYPTPVLPGEIPKPPPLPKPPPPDDGLGDRGFYLEADTLIRDNPNNAWTAQGGVEARYQGRVVRADKVVYDVGKGIVTADGHVQLINEDGSVAFANHMVLDDKMKAGFAAGFAARSPVPGAVAAIPGAPAPTLKFAADVAVRRSEEVEELDRAIFTPCDICAQNGAPMKPTWSISASKIIEDEQKHIVYYRNAVIRVKGLPVFYAPVFWHPDPNAPRSSGLLVPQASIGQKRGFTYDQPMLWVVSPSAELIVDPQLNSKVNPFLNLEWTERFYSGQVDARVGYTYERDFNGNGDKFGDMTSRSFVLANGEFNLTPNWTWGFTAERASDPLIFIKYDITNPYVDHGLFLSDSQRLLSQAYVTRQDDNSYLSIAALDVQGLRPTDNNAAFPLVAPLVEGRWDAPFQVFGGSLRVIGSGVLLERDESPVDPSQPGVDSRRASAEVDWLRTITLDNGMRLQPFVDLRGDLYDISDLSSSDRSAKTITQGLETAGVTWSWPFIKQSGDATIVLEPIAQLALSPDIKPNPDIPNEDSVVFEYDETDLFSPNKFTGYDLFDSGQRLNVGGRATVDWGDGLNAEMLVGRTLRASPTNVFPPNTDLDRQASDWIVAADTTPIDGLSLFERAVFDDYFELDHLELGANWATDRASGYVRYLTDNTQITGPVKDFEASGEFFATKNWGVSLTGVRDLVLNDWRLEELGLIYKDDCIRVQVVYRHENTQVGTLGESDSVFLRLTLATLGAQRYNNGDFR